MNKKSYTNKRRERLQFVQELPFEPTSDSSTENAGRNGINLQEQAVDIDGVQPDDLYKEEKKESTSIPEALDLLVELGDFLDLKNEEVYASFADLLINKIASESKKTYVHKFNDLMIKIDGTDLSDKNETIKKLTNIFSRTFLLELTKTEDEEFAYSSAYKKTLHRAEQYLSDGKMIKSSDINQNPIVVAERIKLIIDSLIARFSNDAKIRAYPNLRSKLEKLNPMELANKKAPGGAALGVSITLIKNILNGRDPQFINLVISNLARLL